MPTNPVITPSGRAGRRHGSGAPTMSVKGVTRLNVDPQGVGKWTAKVGAQFRSFPYNGTWRIYGVTRNSSGNALGDCVVDLYETGTDIKVGSTVSDGSGNYSFTISNNSVQYYLVAYKPGSPDVAGTTVNTIRGAV